MSLREAGIALIDCVHKTPTAVSNGLPYVGIPQMKDGQITFDGARRISETDFAEWTKKAKPKPHDVVLSRRTNPGVTAVFSDCRFALGQNLVLLRADGNVVLPEFLRWLVSGPEWWNQIRKYINVGAVFDSLRCGDVPKFELSIPPKSEQGLIAALLSALDDKIELNRRTNETLEAMARAIFKDWFVDFGPTRAKMEGRPSYLAPDIWTLFPERLDGEGKPSGWLNHSLASIAKQPKGSVSPGNKPDLIFEHYSLPSYDAGQVAALDAGHTIKSNKTPVPSDAVLLSKLNPETSRVWLPHARGEHPQVASTEFLAFQAQSPINRPLLYCLFRSAPFKQLLEGMVTGTSKSHQRISPPALLQQVVLVGDHSVFSAFGDAAAPLLQRQLANRQENRTLATTRDLLLSKLLSGEIRIRDAEAMIADAA
jgi:type I restriction enzyme S subunit